MWPNLSSFGASIDKINDGSDAHKIRVSGDLDDSQINLLTQSGFVYSNEWRGYVRNQPTFKLSELRTWFPKFDPNTMIDKKIPMVLEQVQVIPGLSLPSFNIGGYSMQNNSGNNSLTPNEISSLLGINVAPPSPTPTPESAIPETEVEIENASPVEMQLGESIEASGDSDNEDNDQETPVQQNQAEQFTLFSNLTADSIVNVNENIVVNNEMDNEDDEDIMDDDEDEDQDEVKSKIEDVGEKIGGAIKDRFAGKSIKVSDLNEMTEKEKADNIKKTLIWPYSYKKAKENGAHVSVCYFINKLRDVIPDLGSLERRNPSSTEKSIGERVYVGMLNAVSEHLNESVTSIKELVDALIKMNDDARVKGFMEYFNKDKISIYSERGKKSYSFKKLYTLFRIFEFNQQDYDRRIKDSKPHETLPINLSNFYVKEDADQWLKDYVDRQTNHFWASKIKGIRDNTGKPVIPERPHLDSLKNDWLDGSNKSGNDLIDTFGFRGVEFGNWLPQDERQTVLNEAYASCKALASILAVDDKELSLDGDLAIAFGSRGRGGKKSAAAHYEPDYRVFNLTRKNGAGSMAHEYGHALDHHVLNIINSRLKDISDENNTEYHPVQKRDSALFSIGNERGLKALDWVYEHSIKEKQSYQEITDYKERFGAVIANLIEAQSELINTMKAKKNYNADIKELVDSINRGTSNVESWLDNKNDFKSSFTCVQLIISNIFEESGAPQPSKEFFAELKIAMESNKKYYYEDVLKETVKLNEMGLFDALKNSNKKLDYLSDFSSRTTKQIAEAVQAVSGLNIKKERLKKIEGNLQFIYSRLMRLSEVIKNPERSSERSTEFYDNAVLLDKNRKSYWATSHEMFARAFECFVFDELSKRGERCDYLVHSVGGDLYSSSNFKGNPYPADDERKIINEKMRGYLSHVALLMQEYKKYCENNKETNKKYLKFA